MVGYTAVDHWSRRHEGDILIWPPAKWGLPIPSLETSVISVAPLPPAPNPTAPANIWSLHSPYCGHVHWNNLPQVASPTLLRVSSLCARWSPRSPSDTHSRGISASLRRSLSGAFPGSLLPLQHSRRLAATLFIIFFLLSPYKHSALNTPCTFWPPD